MVTNRPSALYRLDPKIPTASQSYRGRAVIHRTLEAIDQLDWGRIDQSTVERFGGHADERVSTKFLEHLAALPQESMDRLNDRGMRRVLAALAMRARTDAVEEHVIWTLLLDRIALLPAGREAIPDFPERIQAILEWVRSNSDSAAVMPLLRFRSPDIVSIAIRNVRRLTAEAVVMLAEDPTIFLRITKENLYLRPEDGRLMWEWIDSHLTPDIPVSYIRALEELIARHLVPMAPVRRAIHLQWRTGEDDMVRLLLPVTLDERWDWSVEERRGVLDRVIQIGDPSLALTVLDGGLLKDPEHLLDLGQAFPTPQIVARLESHPLLVTERAVAEPNPEPAGEQE